MFSNPPWNSLSDKKLQQELANAPKEVGKLSQVIPQHLDSHAVSETQQGQNATPVDVVRKYPEKDQNNHMFLCHWLLRKFFVCVFLIVPFHFPILQHNSTFLCVWHVCPCFAHHLWHTKVVPYHHFWAKFSWKALYPKMPYTNQHTRELISAWKTSHKYNKDLSRLRLWYLSPDMHVNTRYINSTWGTSCQRSEVP